MKNNEAIIKIQNILEKHPEYKRKLFVRGYIVSNDKYGSINEFPFYSNWNEFVFGDFNIRVHKDQHIYYYGNENKSLILIGNCVNPFSLVYDESKIVKKIFCDKEITAEIFADKIEIRKGGQKREIILDGSCNYEEYDNMMTISSPCDGLSLVIPVRAVDPEFRAEVQAMLLAGSTQGSEENLDENKE